MARLTTAFEKLILSELRLASYDADTDDIFFANENTAEPQADQKAAQTLTDEAVAQAVTVNEELINLGYTLTPADLLRLAGSPSLTTFAAHFRSLLPEVKAPPMYPDFPTQVMEMDEAQFRLHQMIHYFSTYDLEWLFGVQVKRGWLPQMEATGKTESDDTLLKAKVLELVPEEEAPIIALTRLMQKRERLTLPGRALTVEALSYLEPEDLTGLKVPFKENLTELFDAILRSAPETCGAYGGSGASEEETALQSVIAGCDKRTLMWQEICQHTGDVMKCIVSILPRYHYHFRTSQKRVLVKLLETYPVTDFQTNLILSRGKREKNLAVLQYLDYNYYSRSPMHKKAVSDLRNGELRSWESQARYMLDAAEYYAPKDEAFSAGKGEALDFIAKRPGMMLRMISWLLRRGYPDAEIRDRLVLKADAISAHTVVDILNALDLKEEDVPREEIYRALRENEEKARQRYEDVVEDPGALFSKYLMSMTDAAEALRKARNHERYQREKIAELDREYEAARDLYERTAPYTDRVRAILMDVLRAHMEKVRITLPVKEAKADPGSGKTQLASADGKARTGLAGKKVYLQMDEYDLSYSRLEAGKKSAEGGYLPGGMAIRIPDEVRRLRFFVYWNDRERVDVDLHATAFGAEGEEIEIGWDAHFNKGGIVHSGDITHSNAAEYIDIDMEAPLRNAEAVIHLYYGKPSFGKIQTCYVGMMAVKRFKQKVKLYDPKNCFFTHELRSEETRLSYGYVDVQRRLLFFTGKDPERRSRFAAPRGMYRANAPYLSLKKYLELLVSAQGAVITDSEEEADIVFTIGKSADGGAVSLVDENFFLEA